MPKSLFRLVYCSRNVRGDAAADLSQILVSARRNNAACGVTGALLCSGPLFVQALEGPFEAVQTVFERIQADARHDEVVILSVETVPERLFGDCSMATPASPGTAPELVERALLAPKSAASMTLVALLQQVMSQVPA